MATTTITDLPSSRALDYKAMSAIRGGAAGAGDWCLSAFSPYQSAPRSPIVIYGTNYFGQMNLQIQNFDITGRWPKPGG